MLLFPARPPSHLVLLLPSARQQMPLHLLRQRMPGVFGAGRLPALPRPPVLGGYVCLQHSSCWQLSVPLVVGLFPAAGADPILGTQCSSVGWLLLLEG